MEDTTKRLKALSDSTRLRILHLISLTEECCVCEIHEVLELTAPTASRNLRILEEAGFVTKRRAGKWMHYRLQEQDADWTGMRDGVLETVRHSPEAQQDRTRFERWRSPGTCCVNPDPMAIRRAIASHSPTPFTIKENA